MKKTQRQYQETGKKQRLFASFGYQAEFWTRPRRIIAKVEYTCLGPNQRFVVTNLSRNPHFIYDDLYVLRGDVGNRIRELKLDLKADRLSCHRFLANQFRLLLHTAAYCLFWLLRHDLPPAVVPSFKLGWGSSQARAPGGAERSQELWESVFWLQVRVVYNPKHYEA